MLRLMRSFTLALLMLSCLCHAEDDKRVATELIEAAGARQGLCIHLGCGRAENPGLLADIAAQSEFLVHGIALDDASFESAQQAIDTRGVAGRATVERVPLNPLPYVNDLARVVIVEDSAALAAKGLKQDEILRVVSPGGVLLVRENGKWTRTVKPMPKGMDEWTHPQHGADGNLISADSVLTLPAGLRWQDGLPVVTGFRAAGAYVAAGGRLFAAGVDEIENLSAPPVLLTDHTDAGGQAFFGHHEFLTARDAFSGLPLWKLKLGSSYEGGAGNWLNNPPLVATSSRVYAAGQECIITVDAATGKVLTKLKTKYTPTRILLSDNVLVASGWEKKIRHTGDWVWLPKANPAATAGTVEAFDAETGKPLWSLETIAFRLLASNGVIYLETSRGERPANGGKAEEPVAPSEILALDIQTGKQRWRISHDQPGWEAGAALLIAGPDYAAVTKFREKSTVVLAAADGKERFQVSGTPNVTCIVDGLLWLNGKNYDPQTGAIKGNNPFPVMHNGCQQSSFTPNLLLGSHGPYSMQDAKVDPFLNNRNGLRPSCEMSLIPAYGMAFTGANPCACKPGAVYGFTAIGPPGSAPSAADFEQPRPIEKGPGFGPLVEATPETGDWPTFRHDAERSATTSARLPENLKELWRTRIVTAGDDILSSAWRSLCTPVISGPVAQGGLVFVSAADVGQVVALDAASGRRVWTATLGSRITGPPTIYRELCVIGCHDGCVYALRAKDGQLAWRTRVAPSERRIVAFGRVESVWPVPGPVLIHNNVLYATAGRTSEFEGGIALTALDPATGALLWGKAIGPGPERINDTLAVRDGLLAWSYVRFDPKTGTRVSPEKFDEKSKPYDLLGPMIDAAWTVMPSHRRSGNAYMIGNLYASQLAWNESIAVSPWGCIPREKMVAAKSARADAPTWAYSWRNPLATQTQQVEALVMTANTALFAGHNTDPATKKVTGFFWTVALENGKRKTELTLECPPACDGLAVSNERVFLSLSNGELICLGGQ